MARRPRLPKKPVATEALRRAALARDFQALGTPLSAQVVRRAAIGDRKLRPHLLGLVLACGAAVLALIGTSLPVVGIVAAALYGAGYAVGRFHVRRQRARRIGPVVELAGGFDELLAGRVAGLPEDANASLQRIKTMLARVLPALGDTDAAAALTQEEGFFAGEAVARYLPDALRTFAAIPPDRMDIAVGPDARTPRALLLDQLGMVERELTRIEERLAAGSARALARNRDLLARRTLR